MLLIYIDFHTCILVCRVGGGGICYNVTSETFQFFLLGTTYLMYRHKLRGNYEFDCGQYNE